MDPRSPAFESVLLIRTRRKFTLQPLYYLDQAIVNRLINLLLNLPCLIGISVWVQLLMTDRPHCALRSSQGRPACIAWV